MSIAIERQGDPLLLINGESHDVDPHGYNVRIVGPTAPFTVTGFLGGANGELMYLSNATGQPMTLADQNTGSESVNRINTGSGEDISVSCFALLIYDVDLQRWQVVNYA